jgi:predicted alpha/beta-hydrolase family hydrolase
MDVLTDGPADTDRLVILAHGAGAPMDSPFMQAIAGGVGEAGIRVVRFEFPYMAQRRTSGGRRPPDREPVLRETWLKVIEEVAPSRPFVIGGKSMGGRIASMIADEVGARGLVCLGYPFHPAGRPAQLRTAHLETLRTPALILQGERDVMGSCEEVEAYPLSQTIRFEWLRDGDHSFKPRRVAGVSLEDNLQSAVRAVATFVQELG